MLPTARGPAACPPACSQLELAVNQLTGRVPKLSLASLSELSLHSNKLEGPLPALTNLPALKTVQLYSNQLTGGHGRGQQGTAAAREAAERAASCCFRVCAQAAFSPAAPCAAWPMRLPLLPPCASAGSIPSAWYSLSPNVSIGVLPNNLCGGLPRQPFPQLWFVADGISQYPVVNTLGSCFATNCKPQVESEYGGEEGSRVGCAVQLV